MIVLSEYLKDVRVHREALALSKHGYKINIISFSKLDLKNREKLTKNIEVFRLFDSRFKNKNSPVGYLMSYLYFTLQLFAILLFNKQFHKTDVFHIHNPPDILVIPVKFFNLFFQKRIILDRHEPFALSVISHLQLSEKSIVYKMLKAFENMIAKLVDGVIVINQIEKEDYEKAKIKRTVVVGNNTYGYANEELEEEGISANINRSKLNFSDTDIVLLYQGLIGKMRDLDTVLALLKEQISPKYHLVLVGDGPYLEKIKIHIKSMRLSNKVSLVGFVPPNEIKEYIKLADVCLVLASNVPVYRHATPNKLFEYLAYNKRTVVPLLENIIYLTQSNLPYYKSGSKISLARAIKQSLRMSDKEITLRAQKILDLNSAKKDEQRLITLYENVT